MGKQTCGFVLYNKLVKVWPREFFFSFFANVIQNSKISTKNPKWN